MDLSLESYHSIPEAFFAIARECPRAPVYHQAQIVGDDAPGRTRPWRTAAFEDVEKRVKIIAEWLRGKGLRPGDRVAILSNTRPEWMEADLAALTCGAVVVSVYQSLTADEAGYILHDSGATFVFAENAEQLAKLDTLASRPCPIAATEERPAGSAQLSFKTIVTFEETEKRPNVTSLGEILRLGDPARFSGIAKQSRTDLAALVYTSGTTGPPKGVMQSHANHLANVRQARNAGIFDAAATLTLVLPLAHSFAKLMGYIGFLTTASLKFPAVTSTKVSRPDPASITRDIREAGSNIVPIVPRLLEKMKEAVERRAADRGIEGKIAGYTVRSALARYEAAKKGGKPVLSVRLGAALTGPIRKAIKKKIFGKDFYYAVSGGAKLPRAVAEFFDALGIEVLEGYGLTETTVATNVNRAGRKKIGTVGPVLDKDIEVRIAEDGEISFRGPNVASGYFQRGTATKAAWDSDGWFRTGDLGSLDSDGYLSVTGRKKELIVTSGGKKIPPDPIEQEMARCPLVSQAVLFGDERQYCIAIISVALPAANEWAASRGAALAADISKDQGVRDAIWKHIEAMNEHLASYETVKKVLIVPEEFTIENKMLTPTFKVKRREVYARYKNEIAALYESSR
jgi:long-chain acyl-CoA synthetase